MKRGRDDCGLGDGVRTRLQLRTAYGAARREMLGDALCGFSAAQIGRADLEVSLDQLVTQLPNVKRVNLVVGWFGTDVRAGHCEIRPGVERRGKITAPFRWSVAGVDRAEAYVVSQMAEGPAYGGTPSDQSVRQAIRALKACGLEVVVYPFVFMDCEDYPWRGRIKGTDGTGASAEVAQLFGGANGWGLRRQVLHYAQMVAEEGAHGLVIGSEMRGLTLTRDAQGGFPAVAQYQALAAEARAIVGPSVSLTYAADWSEYAGLRDGGEVRFHLDPLWADPNIDYVGIDWYPPMGDWREDDGGLDGAAFDGPWDADYLAQQVAGGRDFDWYYASQADEVAQLRTAISDGAYGEPWVWRVKDLKGWWSNRHYERVGGVRQAVPTAWVPGMKPVRLLEIGCAAVDRGGNAPNLFLDPKSSESRLPAWSEGTRDDRMQRALLEAVLGHFAKPQNNPVSSVYGGPMLAGADAWCWDARPWPAFPAREDLWSDAGAWRTGHWLNGRMQGTAGDLVEALLERAGLSGGWRVEGLNQTISGIVLERPMTTRAALGALLTALGGYGSERDGQVVVQGHSAPVMLLDAERLAMPEDGAPVVREREIGMEAEAVRVRFVQDSGDYQTGAIIVRRQDGVVRPAGAGPLNHVIDFDLPCVVGEPLARQAAKRLLKAQAQERRKVKLGPLEAMQLEAGDVVTLSDAEGRWRVASVAYEEVPSAVLEPVVDVALEDAEEDWRGGDDGGVVDAPFVRFLDLPPLPGAEEDGRPLVAVAADPWWPMAVHGGADADSLIERVSVPESAIVGQLVSDLGAGAVDRWDEVNTLHLKLEGGQAQSVSAGAVLDGSNLLAVETNGGWEVLQYRQAQLGGREEWRLTGLLRGRQGTEAAALVGAQAGAAVVVLDAALVRVPMSEGERGLMRLWRVGPQGLPPGGADFTEVEFAWRREQTRPWRPVHVRGQMRDDGLALAWVPQSRLGAEDWNYEGAGVDPQRFRLTVMSGESVVRQWEVEGVQTHYAQAELAGDFPLGNGAQDRILIAQWGEITGWGEAAVYPLG
ncbi:MAG: baseplate multidomain protein megatron [Janthinobacterium lividum]